MRKIRRKEIAKASMRCRGEFGPLQAKIGMTLEYLEADCETERLNMQIFYESEEKAVPTCFVCADQKHWI
jgi:hypothetical protein